MIDFVSGVLIHTPFWVYLILLFLISRGIKARRPATVALEKLAIIPAIFLLWDIYDLLVFRKLTLATGSLWLVGLLSGAAMGYILIKRTAVARAAAPRSIYREADYSALPFMMLAFAVKYVLGVMSAIAPDVLLRPGVSAFAIITGGLFAGVFVGKFVRYVRVYLAAEMREVG
ncbi:MULTISPECIES: hypothetical protein [Leclercia]|uniref:hypothetical protein n=1 Tax=Leclercia TaxID=83654 RepID=UPI000ED55B35|nr:MULTISPECIES: hypothetical protein [Leclercia]UGB04762.1 hypothetical protein LRS40_12345 [Leclercia sp. G3L]HCN97917.1 hypothetical protein [Leclercia sp.]